MRILLSCVRAQGFLVHVQKRTAGKNQLLSTGEHGEIRASGIPKVRRDLDKKKVFK